MRSFEMPTMQPAEFVARVRGELAERGYDRHLAVNLDGSRLTIEFRWMGTSRFDYRIETREQGFRADLVSERISPLHSAFTHRFEHYFEQALSELDATSA